jgi:hypothetical protein
MIIIRDTCTINIINECKYASRMINDDSRVTLQIVAQLTDDSRGSIYDFNMFTLQATD